MSHTAGMDAHSEQIERVADAVETATGQPEATGPLMTPEEGLLGDQIHSADQRILDDAAVTGDLSELLEVDNSVEAYSTSTSESPISSKASARSSLYEYIEENGRKYNRYKGGTYMLPSDESEQDRLDLQHHLFLLGFDDKLYLAPIEDTPLQNVLDVATGTGIWATDFATSFPAVNVVGTDLSPIQTPHTPPNCRFVIEDVEEDWSFPAHSFDYIHGRAFAACFKDHVPVFRSAFKALRPGGYFEMHDAAIPFRSIDGSIKDTAFERWQKLVKEGTDVLGRDFGRVPKYKSYFEKVGFVDIVEKQLAWPIGSWAKDSRMKKLGAWVKENVLSGLHGWSAAVLTRGLGISSQEVDTLLMEVRSDINSNLMHAYIPIFAVYGRKPMDLATVQPVPH